METIIAKTPWRDAMGDIPMHLEYFEGSMFDKVKEIAGRYPDHIAFDFLGRSTTYRKMVEEIERCAKALKMIGVREGDRVTIALPNCPQAIYLFYAVNLVGAVCNMIHPLSAEKVDNSTGAMDDFNRLPRFVSKTAIRFLMLLDRHGRVPEKMISTDPYYSSVVISNLGSLKLKSGYHHLTNWGTCSIICLIGEIRNRPVFFDDGHYEMKPSVDLGLTIDERLADGYYYSRTLHLIKTLLENPELLEQPLGQEVDF